MFIFGKGEEMKRFGLGFMIICLLLLVWSAMNAFGKPLPDHVMLQDTIVLSMDFNATMDVPYGDPPLFDLCSSGLDTAIYRIHSVGQETVFYNRMDLYFKFFDSLLAFDVFSQSYIDSVNERSSSNILWVTRRDKHSFEGRLTTYQSWYYADTVGYARNYAESAGLKKSLGWFMGRARLGFNQHIFVPGHHGSLTISSVIFGVDTNYHISGGHSMWYPTAMEPMADTVAVDATPKTAVLCYRNVGPDSATIKSKGPVLPLDFSDKYIESGKKICHLAKSDIGWESFPVDVDCEYFPERYTNITKLVFWVTLENNPGSNLYIAPDNDLAGDYVCRGSETFPFNVKIEMIGGNRAKVEYATMADSDYGWYFILPRNLQCQLLANNSNIFRLLSVYLGQDDVDQSGSGKLSLDSVVMIARVQAALSYQIVFNPEDILDTILHQTVGKSILVEYMPKPDGIRRDNDRSYNWKVQGRLVDYYLDNDQEAKLLITDMLGRSYVLWSGFAGAGWQQIRLPDGWPAGVYMLELQTSKGTLFKKICCP